MFYFTLHSYNHADEVRLTDIERYVVSKCGGITFLREFERLYYDNMHVRIKNGVSSAEARLPSDFVKLNRRGTQVLQPGQSSLSLEERDLDLQVAMASDHGFKGEGMIRRRFDEVVVLEVPSLVSRQER